MLQVKDLRKTYVTERGEVAAVCGVGFEVGDGEIFTLLGASGCGKSTTLRCVAGLEVPDDGEIAFGDRVVFSRSRRMNIPVHQRAVGMVFQSYAIWPHMTVFENVAFPLQEGPYKVPKMEIARRVHRAIERVKLDGLADRPAPELSGGQQQRIALARAIVYEPTMLLFDEPLSNLDAQLRIGMRTELKSLIKDINVTALYVTHDQEEALIISDRIGVMKDGVIQQVAAPRDLYDKPANVDVARFVGRANLFAGTVEGHSHNGTVLVNCDLGKVETTTLALSELRQQHAAVWMMIRPEDVVIHAQPHAQLTNAFPATVVNSVFVGNRTQCELRLGADSCLAETDGHDFLASGSTVHVELPRERIRLFPRMQD